MIRINCTNCKALLTIDEAFAGGVCRCQHCGTIQTVPSHLKNAAATQGAQSKPVGSAASKTLYQRKLKSDGSPGSGLDAIAEVIASSGLSGSGLSSGPKRPKREAYEIPAKKNWLMPLLIGAGALILILAAAVIYLAVRGPAVAPTPAPSVNATPSDQPQPEVAQPSESLAPKLKLEFHPPREPSFLGQPIKEPSVVYLLDSSMATRSTFDPMVQACFRSIESLKPNQKFAVIFWHSDTDAAFPASGMAAATPQNIAAAKDKLKDVYASGASNIQPSLKKALALNPAVIDIVSGKWLQDDFAKTVLDTRKGSSVKINCFSLGQSDSAPVMKKISDTTKGQFHEVSADELKAFGQ
jgi:hypothetical protein